jgi:dTDP-4-dehydro-6-deoxy-alpha-D-glucopyranose 2,3-dehydratase
MLREGEEIQVPPEYMWISEDDLYLFINIGEMVNSCARSVVSILLCREDVR